MDSWWFFFVGLLMSDKLLLPNFLLLREMGFRSYKVHISAWNYPKVDIWTKMADFLCFSRQDFSAFLWVESWSAWHLNFMMLISNWVWGLIFQEHKNGYLESKFLTSCVFLGMSSWDLFVNLLYDLTWLPNFMLLSQFVLFVMETYEHFSQGGQGGPKRNFVTDLSVPCLESA